METCSLAGQCDDEDDPPARYQHANAFLFTVGVLDYYLTAIETEPF